MQFNNETGRSDKANLSRNLNVMSAWIRGATGLDVVVGMVDNGDLKIIHNKIHALTINFRGGIQQHRHYILTMCIRYS